jgi:hypothetical protein
VCRRSGGFGGDLEEESDDRRAGVFAALAVVAAAALARGEREQRLEQAVSRHVAADLTVRLSSLKQGHQRLSDRGVLGPEDRLVLQRGGVAPGDRDQCALRPSDSQ